MKQGFGPGFGTVFRGIAQLVEQRSPKPRAEGSSPSAPAKTALCGYSLLWLSRQSTSLVRTRSPVRIWLAAPKSKDVREGVLAF